jgi:hypothetical protein
MYVHLFSYRLRGPLVVEMGGETTGWRTRWKTVPHLFALPFLFHHLLYDISDPRDRGRLATVFFRIGG